MYFEEQNCFLLFYFNLRGTLNYIHNIYVYTCMVLYRNILKIYNLKIKSSSNIKYNHFNAKIYEICLKIYNCICKIKRYVYRLTS